MKPQQQSLLIGIVILVIFALIGWNAIVTSPQYSIYQMYQSIKKHDYPTFQHYVDVDSVSTDLATRTVAKTNAYIPKGNGIVFLQFGINFAKNIIKDMQPTLKQGFKDAIQKGVETGTIKTALPNIDTFSKAMTQVKATPNGDVDDVTITDKSKTLHVTMKQVDKHWQVTKMGIEPEDLQTNR